MVVQSWQHTAHDAYCALTASSLCQQPMPAAYASSLLLPAAYNAPQVAYETLRLLAYCDYGAAITQMT